MGHRPKRIHDLIPEIISTYRELQDMKATSEKTGVAPKSIRKILKENNIHIVSAVESNKMQYQLAPEKIEAIRHALRSGKEYSEIRREIGVSSRSIAKYGKGIKPAGSSNRIEKEKIDEIIRLYKKQKKRVFIIKKLGINGATVDSYIRQYQAEQKRIAEEKEAAKLQKQRERNFKRAMQQKEKDRKKALKSTFTGQPIQTPKNWIIGSHNPLSVPIRPTGNEKRIPSLHEVHFGRIYSY